MRVEPVPPQVEGLHSRKRGVLRIRALLDTQFAQRRHGVVNRVLILCGVDEDG